LGLVKRVVPLGFLEGMKHDKKIYIMTPASLQENYRTQMSFCGDKLFTTKHHWKKVKSNSDVVYQLFKQYLFLDNDKELLEKYMTKYNNYVWLIHDDDTEPNYEMLNNEEKQQIKELNPNINIYEI